jgi:hypothetical protein
VDPITRKIIRLRAAAHAFEGKVFLIASPSSLDEDAIEQISGGNPENRTLLENTTMSDSMIVGPTGQIPGEPAAGREGFAFAEIDISEAIVLKEAHDIIGRYKRFDAFQVRVNQKRIKPVRLYEAASTFEDHVPSPVRLGGAHRIAAIPAEDLFAPLRAHRPLCNTHQPFGTSRIRNYRD